MRVAIAHANVQLVFRPRAAHLPIASALGAELKLGAISARSIMNGLGVHCAALSSCELGDGLAMADATVVYSANDCLALTLSTTAAQINLALPCVNGHAGVRATAIARTLEPVSLSSAMSAEFLAQADRTCWQ
jgi:hypothetical protein